MGNRYNLKQRVEKKGEDSYFEGEVVAIFLKRNGKSVRYVVENDDGVCLICNEKQLSDVFKGR